MAEPRKAALAVAVIVIGLGVVPVVLERDSYPVSDLPMFSSPRGRVTPVVTAVAVAGAGPTRRDWRLDPHRLAGTDEVIEAGAVLRRAVASGDAERICVEIAERVDTAGPEEAERVEVVTEYLDAVDYFDGRRDPVERILHAECPVERVIS